MVTTNLSSKVVSSRNKWRTCCVGTWKNMWRAIRVARPIPFFRKIRAFSSCNVKFAVRVAQWPPSNQVFKPLPANEQPSELKLLNIYFNEIFNSKKTCAVCLFSNFPRVDDKYNFSSLGIVKLWAIFYLSSWGSSLNIFWVPLQVDPMVEIRPKQPFNMT